MKKAYLVNINLCTRVVIDENATEEQVVQAGIENIMMNPRGYLDESNCDVEDDIDSPANEDDV